MLFQCYFMAADLVVAKGQGNYETLSDEDKNIFFILKAKCPLIAQHLGCDVGQMVMKRGNTFAASNMAKGGEAHAWI